MDTATVAVAVGVVTASVGVLTFYASQRAASRSTFANESKAMIEMANQRAEYFKQLYEDALAGRPTPPIPHHEEPPEPFLTPSRIGWTAGAAVVGWGIIEAFITAVRQAIR